MRGEVASEFRFDHTRISMGTSYSAPNNSNFGTFDGLLCSVNVGNPFAKIELGFLRGADTFNLNKRGVGPTVALSTLVSQYTALAVES